MNIFLEEYSLKADTLFFFVISGFPLLAFRVERMRASSMSFLRLGVMIWWFIISLCEVRKHMLRFMRNGRLGSPLCCING